MVLSISKLWNSLTPSEKLGLLNFIKIPAENVDIGVFEDQYPSFQKALKKKSNLIKAWKRKSKNELVFNEVKQNEKLLKSGTYSLI